MYHSLRLRENLRNLFLSAFWAVALSNSYFFPMYLLHRIPVPMVDEYVMLPDIWLGLYPPRLFSFLEAHPWISLFSDLIYYLLLPLIILAVLIPPLRKEWRLAQEYHLSMAFSALLSLPMIALIHFQTPWAYFGYPPKAIFEIQGKVFLELQSQAPFLFSLDQVQGMVQCPSFHTILAIQCYLSLKNTPYLSKPALALALLIPISALPSGGHYLIDIVAGVVLAFLTRKMAQKFLDHLN